MFFDSPTPFIFFFFFSSPLLTIRSAPRSSQLDAKGAVVDTDERHCHQILSAAADGTCLVWDLRLDPREGERDRRGSDRRGSITANGQLRHLDLQMRPLLKVYVSAADTPEYLVTRACIAPPSAKLREALSVMAESGAVEEQMQAVQSSTKLYVGTEQGQVATLDMQPPESESGKLGVQAVDKTANIHGGMVVALQRSPFFPLFSLSVSADCLCLWKEGLVGPLLHYRAAGVRYTSAAWSFHRPAVFFIGRADGRVDVWDLTNSSYAPTSSQPVCQPTAVSFLEQGHLLHHLGGKVPAAFLAVGNVDGVVHMMELPKGATQPVSNEVRGGGCCCCTGVGWRQSRPLFNIFPIVCVLSGHRRCRCWRGRSHGYNMLRSVRLPDRRRTVPRPRRRRWTR